MSAPLHTARQQSVSLGAIIHIRFYKQSVSLAANVQAPALTCQPSCTVKAALQTVIFGCNWSAKLQFGIPSQIKVLAEVHTFQPCCSFAVRLQSVGKVAVSQHCCTVSPPLQLCLNYVSPAAVCQLSCMLSAQLQSCCSSVFCPVNYLL